jgi:hypothetical protein
LPCGNASEELETWFETQVCSNLKFWLANKSFELSLLF